MGVVVVVTISISGDDRQTVCLLQRLSAALKKGNLVTV